MKTNLYQVGATDSGKKVYAGVYTFYARYGLPLEVLFNIALDQDWIPCWISFYREARAAGMQHDRILSKLEEAVCDSFGSEYAAKVISKLTEIFHDAKSKNHKI